MNKISGKQKVSFAGLLIAIGIVYGDIGTSPLYVMKSIVTENGGISNVNRELIVGSISLIFWTVTLLTTVKYVIIALKATNHGEGGIFSLYALVRKRAKWLVIPALIGGAALLADGTLTPAVTVTTSIEGLKNMRFGDVIPVSSQDMVILITIVILVLLFSIQRMGTSVIGKAFGPIMLLWFTFLGLIGLMNLSHDWSLLDAINPIHALRILFSPANKVGILILGSIFLIFPSSSTSSVISAIFVNFISAFTPSFILHTIFTSLYDNVVPSKALSKLLPAVSSCSFDK